MIAHLVDTVDICQLRFLTHSAVDVIPQCTVYVEYWDGTNNVFHTEQVTCTSSVCFLFVSSSFPGKAYVTIKLRHHVKNVKNVWRGSDVILHVRTLGAHEKKQTNKQTKTGRSFPVPLQRVKCRLLF